MTVNQKSIRDELRRYILPALALLFIAAFYAYCAGRVQTEFPILRPQDGVLDTREDMRALLNALRELTGERA